MPIYITKSTKKYGQIYQVAIYLGIYLGMEQRGYTGYSQPASFLLAPAQLLLYS